MNSDIDRLEALRTEHLGSFDQVIDVLEAGPHFIVHGRAGGTAVVACHDPEGRELGRAAFSEYTVSAWAASPEHGWLMIAQDDTYELLALPGLERLARDCIEPNIHTMCIDPQRPRALMAVGCQGNYLTHGNLRLVELPGLQWRELLEVDREVVDCELRPNGRVRFVLGSYDECDDTYEEGWIEEVGATPVVPGALRRLSAAEIERINQREAPPVGEVLERLLRALGTK